MEEKLDPLSYADVIFHKTLLQLIFEAVYHHQEQGPQPEDVNFDYDAYFQEHTVIEDDQWDNELPVLMYHGISMDCDVYLMTHLHEMFGKINQQYGKNIHSECLVVGTPGDGEQYDSIFKSVFWQTESYCQLVQQHPVFGKSDFNIIALSQGGLEARSMIQDCDLGEHKVRNFLSVAGPQ